MKGMVSERHAGVIFDMVDLGIIWWKMDIDDGDCRLFVGLMTGAHADSDRRSALGRFDELHAWRRSILGN